MLYDVPLLSLDELLAKAEAVTSEDLATLASEFYDPEQLSAACIGPSEDRFRTAVESVSPALAAA